MHRKVLQLYREHLGKSQRVINALDKLDTEATTQAATVDSRVRVSDSLDDVAAQTLVITDLAGSMDVYTHQTDGQLQVIAFARTKLQAMRIRDAVRREFLDQGRSWPQLASTVGRILHQEWIGDGSVDFIDGLNLYRADGTFRVIVQMSF